MKKNATIILMLLALLSSYAQETTYSISIDTTTYNRFHVSISAENLDAENDIFQFASTAPGTYQVMDIGRLVENFTAYDKKGKSIATERISTNQWKLSNPKKVRRIEYTINETWDTPVDKHLIYRMCGSSLEMDHAFINGHAVFGYVKGKKNIPFRVKLTIPSEWTAGTALDLDENGYYLVNNFDHMVDSPILSGQLTRSSKRLGNTEVEIYSYSKQGLIPSNSLMSYMESMLVATEEFVVELPVDRYTFLFHFEDQSWGAWEHSYSSAYVFTEQPLDSVYSDLLLSTASHEFFHIITPLNIHSEIIEDFNYIKPTPSKHLWLYEGVTEWASDILLLRANVISLKDYLNETRMKLLTADQYDSTLSLVDLALTSYSKEGQMQYPNIYMRGALTAMLLDILILDLSEGKQGLREVILKLSKKYGPNEAFDETGFFDEFVSMSSPEVREFIENHIVRAQALPLQDLFEKVGINYTPEVRTGKQIATVGTGITGATDGNLYLKGVSQQLIDLGIKENDQLIAIDGTNTTYGNIQTLFTTLSQKPIGSPFELTIGRDGEEMVIKCKIMGTEQIDKHVLKVDPSATSEQQKLRNIWLKNVKTR